MKDYYNRSRHVKYLGIVTGKQFEAAYNEMAASPDKLPVASSLLQVTEANGGTLYASEETNEPLYEAFIYYETKPDLDNARLDPKTGTIQEPVKPKIKLEL